MNLCCLLLTARHTGGCHSEKTEHTCLFIPTFNSHFPCLNHDNLFVFFSEIDLGTKCVVDMDNSQTMLFHPSTGMKDR